MNRSFQRIDDLIKDLYGVRLLEEPISPRLSGIRELVNAHDAIVKMMKEQRRPLTAEFVQCVYPLVELEFKWSRLKKAGNDTRKFRQRCKRHAENEGKKLNEFNFYGTIFEIGMAADYLLKGWQVTFVEDSVKIGKPIDFLLHGKGKQQQVCGVQCLSKRYAGRWGKHGITVDMLNTAILKKAEKFTGENLSKLPLLPDVRLLLIDLTTTDYSAPAVLGYLQDQVKITDRLDVVVFAWTEEISPRLAPHENHSIRWRYQVVGDAKKAWLPDQWEALVFEAKGSISGYGVRPYVYPPPTIRVSQPETLEEYLGKHRNQL